MLTPLRYWLLAVSCGFCSIVAQAQTSAPALPAAPSAPAAPAPAPAEAGLLRPSEVPGKYKIYLEQRYAGDVGAQELIKHYSHRQTGGALWLAAGVGAISFVASQTGTTTSNSGTTTFKVSPLGYGILLGLFGGVGVGKLTRFSNEKLFDALLVHDQQAGLPGRAVSRLPASPTN